MQRQASTRRLAVAGLLATAALALALRVAAARDDYWLDEIETWYTARSASSAAQILFERPSDNNHPLNTLFVYALGADAPWRATRALSVATGAASALLVAGLLAPRLGAGALIGALFFAVSFPLVVYGSEARGYAPMLCFALLALLALDRLARGGRALPWIAVFQAASLAGFLSHFSYLQFHLAALVWSGAGLRRRSGPSAATFALLHAPPLVAFAAYGWTTLRHLTVAGGPAWSASDLATAVAGQVLGTPQEGVGGALSALLAAGLFAAGLLHLRRAGSDLWLFYALVIAIAPVAVLVGVRPAVVHPRYFLVAACFLLLLIAELCVCLVVAGGVRAALGAALAVFVLAGNAREVASFLDVGRGRYASAVAHLLEAGDGGAVTIASDHDYRNGRVLQFYLERRQSPPKVVYYAQDQRPPAPPTWLIVHSLARAPAPAPALDLPNGPSYRLEASYPVYGPSGFHWFLYRRGDP